MGERGRHRLKTWRARESRGLGGGIDMSNHLNSQDIERLLNSPEYYQVRNNINYSKFMFVTLSGSHAYGTNVEGQDVDIRGLVEPQIKDMLGLAQIGQNMGADRFDQFRDADNDITIYGFNRFMQLAVSGNPNALELLGCRQDQYALVQPEGQLLLDNKHLFVTKKAARQFSGYADEQLNRLKLFIAKNNASESQRLQETLLDITNKMQTYEAECDIPHGAFEIGVRTIDGQSKIVIVPSEEILYNQHSGYDIAKLKLFISKIQERVKVYETVGKRNSYAMEKSPMKLNKHIMSLVRAYNMGIDMLETGEIVTYREKDHDLLMSIRSGQMITKDGQLEAKFSDLLNVLRAQFRQAMDRSKIPEAIDKDAVGKLIININKQIIDKRK